MAHQSLHSHEVEEQITRLIGDIQAEKDSCKLIELVEALNWLLEERETQLLVLRAGKGC